jgi:biofilm PGA synthesis N-glycosyltransferase PgaC
MLRIIWEEIPRSFYYNQSEAVTLLIPVRNEETSIFTLLESLNHQSFPLHLLEVLVIDDHSDDRTLDEVRRAAKHARYSLKTIRLTDDQHGKKMASTIGNANAQNEIILCTDADVVPSHNWISAMTGPLVKSELQMVTGPVSFTSSSLFESIQSLEFAGLIGFGAISLHRRMPTMCNGANMAYKKKAFKAVNGYLDNLHIPSGDDEFLMRKIFRRFNGSVAFVKSPLAEVKTLPKTNISDFWSQRVRWISKWRFHGSMIINLLAIVSFFVFLNASYTFLSLVFQKPLLFAFLIVFFTGAVGMYLREIANFFSRKFNSFHLAVLVLIYPYYAVILGIASIFGSYSWKGRKYK